MSQPTRLPAKKDVVLALLESTDVFVHLDPRTKDAKLPQWFKHQPHLVLQIGLNMPVPIPDLEVDDDAVSCTLSFNRSPFFCFVPWSAVYALVGADGRAMVWPDDVPPEVAAQAAQMQNKQASRAHLRAVPEGEDSTDAEADGAAAAPVAPDPDVPDVPDVEAGAGESASKEPVVRDPKQLELRMVHSEPEPPLRSQPRSSKPEGFEAEGGAAELDVADGADEHTDAEDQGLEEAPKASKPSNKKKSLPPYLRIVK